MAAGIPIICSDFPAWRSVVEPVGAGLCVDPSDFEEVIAAIQYLLDHPDEAQQLGRNGRRAFEEQYNWDSEAEKLVRLYRELVTS